jgi:hypothetical protein
MAALRLQITSSTGMIPHHHRDFKLIAAMRRAVAGGSKCSVASPDATVFSQNCTLPGMQPEFMMCSVGTPVPT